MMPTAARVVAANAAVTAAGAASCSVRSAAWISCGARSRLRWRPPRLSAARIFDRLRRPASAGSGRDPARRGRLDRPGRRTPPARPGSTRATRCAAVGVPGARPDQVLVARASTLIASASGAVAGDRAVVVPVGADQIGEHLGVTGIGLRSCDVVAVAIAGHRQRVDRVHLIAGRSRARPPTGLGRSRSRPPPRRGHRHARRPARATAGSRPVLRAAAATPAVSPASFIRWTS